MSNELLTTDQIAELLHCTRGCVYRLFENKKIPYIRLGRKYLVPEDRFNEWINNQCDKSQA